MASSPFPTVAGGQQMASFQLRVVAAANDDAAPSLFAFTDGLLTSAWWQGPSQEYGVTATDTTHTMGPALSADIAPGALADYVTSAAGAPDGRTLYLVFLPRGVHLSGANCTDGSHDVLGQLGDALAVVQRCSDGPDDLAALETIASREVLDTATDPSGQGYVVTYDHSQPPWNESPWVVYHDGDELGDLCSTRAPTVDNNGFSYALWWSNAASLSGGDPCQPAVAPYYTTVVPDSWVTEQIGGAFSLRITAPVDEILSAGIVSSSHGVFIAHMGGDGGTYVGAKAGTRTAVTVTVGQTALKGDWALVGIRAEATANSPSFDRQVIGVFIP
jgi:hypothetical protein